MLRIRNELSETDKHPINFDDCPELSPEALKEFAFMAAERNRHRKRQSVIIRLDPVYLSKYKALGEGYANIMADVLSYAADNPELLTRASTR
ncbi:BrnA antitoxin family protein [Treponema endosymbiont of Eucomonympha sp.]|uniref:BrnA antitoxin family protein n=1 Tax=Treponema endosymbiont of Eucomonympha sp. TaxID=1580831 RepID=UPI000781DE0E|nr:BrnA antitoxin family protein [Treponema endosymbiont of Eucomonympha sp.]